MLSPLTGFVLALLLVLLVLLALVAQLCVALGRPALPLVVPPGLQLAPPPQRSLIVCAAPPAQQALLVHLNVVRVLFRARIRAPFMPALDFARAPFLFRNKLLEVLRASPAQATLRGLLLHALLLLVRDAVVLGCKLANDWPVLPRSG